MAKGKRKLPNYQHERFIAEYVECLNGSEAARRAGYSPAGAHVQASALLSRPEIREEIARQMAARSKMPGDEIIVRLEEQAQADIALFLKPGTLEIDPEKVHKYGHLIQRIMTTKEGVRIELHDSQKALELLGKTRALFIDRGTLEFLSGLELRDDTEEKRDQDSHRPHPSPPRKTKRNRV